MATMDISPHGPAQTTAGSKSAKKSVISDVDHNIELMTKSIKSSRNGMVDNVAIGIDLGTKNCCVAVFINDKVHVIPNSFRKKTTASYVSFEKSGSITIGQAAKNLAWKNPEYTIFDSKRMIGRDMNDANLIKGMEMWKFGVKASSKNTPEIEGRDTVYSPEQISALLLEDCKNMAETFLQNKQVTSAVITVPAYFNDNQKRATIKAGEIAGLKVLKLLNEPTSAAIAYRMQRIYKESKRVLVFDLGGGTFDVAIVELDENKIKVIAIGGDAFLGGEDFDSKVVKYCLEKFKEEHGEDIEDANVNTRIPRSLALIREECEKQKIFLDSKDEITITVPSVVGDKDLEVDLTRQQYEDMTEYLIDKMIKVVSDTLNEVATSKHQINDIILVGASTRAPKLQERLRKYFGGKTLNSQIDPDEAVAYGAAVYAAYLDNKTGTHTSLDLQVIQDVVPMSIGIKARIKGKEDKFSVVIKKNTQYPLEKKSRYYTVDDNQTAVRISIYQGEEEMASDNYLLGDFVLSGIPENGKGFECVMVNMTLDHNGILCVTAISESTNGSNSLVVKNLNELWS